MTKHICRYISQKYSWTAFIFLMLTSSTVYSYEAVVPRYALIIGNANYQFSPLKNPVNDAKEMAATLKSLRYKVTVALDTDPTQIRKTVLEFYNSVKEKDAISLFYYAGHAMQSNNINYLIPVNAGITSFSRMTTQALSINELLSALRQAASRQNIIILDACRNNPFRPESTNAKNRESLITDKSLLELPGGLAPVEAPTGTLIAYSTEPGNVASDGAGKNGTYTAALLKYITKAETAESLFKRVRKDVLAATDNRQTPWEHSSLIEQFYFIPPSNKEVPDIVSF